MVCLRKHIVFSLFVILSALVISGRSQDDDDNIKAVSYKKDKAGKKPKRPRPKPPPPPPKPTEVKPEFTFQPKQENTFAAADPCDEFSKDPCVCSSNKICQFDESSSKCITADPKFSTKLACQRPNAFYGYNSKALCKSAADADVGGCANATSVFSVNLNGQRYEDSSQGLVYTSEFGILKLDSKGLSKPATASCEVQGAKSPEEGSLLYGTFVEGDTAKKENGSCVSYPIPILQDGEFELTVKTVAESSRCFDIKLGGASVAADVNLMNLTGDQSCMAMDIVFLFLVEKSGKLMHIKGHTNPVPIDGGFSLKFCVGSCDAVPDAVFRASAFSLVRFGHGTKVFENMELTISTYGDGTQSFKAVALPQPKKLTETEEAEAKEKLEQKVKDKVDLKEQCPAIPELQPVQCKKTGCEYSIETGQCGSGEILCAEAVFGKVNCLRANSYRMSGGILCKSPKKEQGECEVTEVKFALNMFGEALQDTRGITYVGGKGDDSGVDNPDHEYISLGDEMVESGCKNNDSTVADQVSIAGVKKGESKLYETLVRGTGASADCLNFPISITNDGTYELSIRTMEPFYKAAGKRAFDIHISGQPIAVSLDIFSYVGSCTAMELITQFQVTRGGLQIAGFSKAPTPIVDKTVNISFCYGQAKEEYEDHSYILTGLYVVKLKADGDDEVEVQPEPEWNYASYSGEEFKDKGAETDDDGSGSGEDEPEDNGYVPCDECRFHHGDIQGCKEAGLQYDLKMEKCRPGFGPCEFSDFVDDFEPFCRRQNVFYVMGGLICQNNDTDGLCAARTQIHGVNLGGQEYVDSLGTVYKADGIYAKDPEGVKQPGDIPNVCPTEGVPDEDVRAVWASYMVGERSNDSTTRETCISYDIPICQDGLYELSVKMVDTVPQNQRYFDIKIDGEPVFVGVDPARLSTDECWHASDVVFPIYVESSGEQHLLNFYGFEEPISVLRKFQLQFCSCDWPSVHQGVKASAFSFVRFGEGGIACNLCNAYKGKEAACVAAGCDFLPGTQMCSDSATDFASEPLGSCKENFGNANLCKKEGCQYNLVTGQCTKEAGQCDEAKFEDYSNCRRAGAYYSDAGVFCKNAEGSPECSEGKTIWAVNLNGKDFTSERGIQYVAEEPSFHIDPKGLRVTSASDRFCSSDNSKADPSSELSQLFGTSVIGNSKKKKPGACISYPMPVCQDGNYELSLLMLDGSYNEPNKRCFDIQINSVTVSYAIDLNRMGAPCDTKELITLFKVEKNASELWAQGHNTPIIIICFLLHGGA